MSEEKGLKKYYGTELALMLAEKIINVYPEFNTQKFVSDIEKNFPPLEMIARTELIAECLRRYLPNNYKKALEILVKILGPENPLETGMFTTGYWLWPIAKFIEFYGLEHFEESMHAIYEITKRHTGEFAIRPYINKYPAKSLTIIKEWAIDKNVHVRRLASEGLRPKLPWAKTLTLFIEDPKPVFEILDLLKDDKSKFVQKSVANNINDYLKLNTSKALELLEFWRKGATPQREWVIKHATRNLRKK